MKINFNLGWILSIAAAVIVAAMVFLSLFYSNDGNGVIPAIVAACMLVLPIVAVGFLVPAKECSKPFYFHSKAIVELVFLAVIIVLFATSIVLVDHFFTVNSRTNEISNAIAEQRNDYDKMFEDYESYCNKRIVSYTDYLDSVNADDTSQAINSLKESISFPKGDADVIYGSGKKRWWNLPSEMGNIDIVSNALAETHNALSERDRNPEAPDYDSRHSSNNWWNYEPKNAADIKALFTNKNGIVSNIWSVASILLAYIFIMLPYIAAERDSRSKGLFAELKTKK